MTSHMDTKENAMHVDALESGQESTSLELEQESCHGNVRLLQDGAVVLIPTPSPDPKDPLNLPTWHKYMIIAITGAYSATAILGTSGLGAVLPSVLLEYPNDDPARVSDLLTYPTLFMGIGNLFSMPLSLIIGRRPVFLFSVFMLIVTGFWCAFAPNLSVHIAGRNFFSIAAGQSEALGPLMVEEIHFLHERGYKIAWYIGVGTVGTASLMVATVHIVPELGLKWWYLIMTFINILILIMAYIWTVETKYDRVLPDEDDTNTQKTRETHVLQPEVYGERTWAHNLRIFHYSMNWKQILVFYKETLQCFALPNMVWILLLNGACLGVYIYQTSTFAVILSMPPYLFKTDWIGWVQLVQVVDGALAIPIIGFGADLFAKWMSRRNGGMFKPEYRLIILVIPGIAVILSCVLYGQAAAHPTEWHWMTIAASFHMGYFAFLSANLVGITYAVDSFSSKAGPLLMVICVGRGFISFGLSYSTVPLIDKLGYDGGMNVFAIICGVLLALAIPVYFLSGRIRRLAAKKLWPEIGAGH